MISQVVSYVQALQIEHVKCVQFFVYQLYFPKFKKMTNIALQKKQYNLYWIYLLIQNEKSESRLSVSHHSW